MTHDEGRHETPPTVAIYQNPEHVSGIIQQAFNTGLLTGEQRDREDQSSTGTSGGKRGDTGMKAAAAVPGIGEASFDVGGGLEHTNTADQTTTGRWSQNYVYSQAYYLYHVRRTLVEVDRLHIVSDKADADSLKPGDFVEFEATFQPNELSALLDILTPSMIRAAVYHYFRQDGVKRFDGYDTFDELQQFSFKNEEKARTHADLAEAITAAIRVDFRSEKTREYYGTIGARNNSVTAVTICDAAHFIVEDEDRILDGHFRVLGKVTSPVAEQVPVLQRNKLLDRLNPVMVDELFTTLREAASKEAIQLEGHATNKRSDDQDSLTQPFDLALASRITGPSFQVIPIAIYI